MNYHSLSFSIFALQVVRPVNLVCRVLLQSTTTMYQGTEKGFTQIFFNLAPTKDTVKEGPRAKTINEPNLFTRERSTRYCKENDRFFNTSLSN